MTRKRALKYMRVSRGLSTPMLHVLDPHRGYTTHIPCNNNDELLREMKRVVCRLRRGLSL